jgi:hypothetical protein
MQAELNIYCSIYGDFKAFDCDFDQVPANFKVVDESQSPELRTLELNLCGFPKEVQDAKAMLARCVGNLCSPCSSGEALPPINMGRLLRALEGIKRGSRGQYQFRMIGR